MFRELNKSYEPTAIEPRWAEIWAQSGWFHASTGSLKPTWSLVIPPPNVTGSLHMGHMLEHTLIDAIVRWRRMRGDNTLWLPGTDHAGIATQMVVERELAKQGVSRRDLGRDAFVAKVWEWKEQSGGRIKEQMIRTGASCDWSRERFTLDAGLSRAVREVFVSLYEEGLIYRGRYIVNWCPRCQTAVSDLEVVHEPVSGKLYHIRYDVVGEPGRSLVVATTRPETMLGDTAVAVNPRDERYLDIIGKKVRLPLAGREIPVIADELAQPEFGTGAVKVTPAHDPNDFAAGQRHQLPEIAVMDETGHMNENAGPAYAGMDRFAARKQILADLEASGELVQVEDHAMAIGHCQRCRTVIEPRVSTQWFVKVAPLAKDAMEVVENGSIRFLPENYTKTYFDWMTNIHDWCISRQLWWGHRIPAWYCQPCGETLVSRDDLTACPKCGGTLTQETDVLDTWFSSGLWPFSTLGWPDDTADLKKFYPTSLLITGFDILFFWVARMIMLGVHFMKRDGRPLADAVPFHTVYIHALVRDADKQKMSKTKGNVIDPLIVADKFGTDAVRFTLASMAAPGTDIALSEQRMEGYAAFANKIWNAARFIFMTLDRAEEQGRWQRPQQLESGLTLEARGSHVIDRWIFSRLNAVARQVQESLTTFRFHEAADTLYHFFWHEFCDWYIELVKLRLNLPAEATPAQIADVKIAADNLLVAFEGALRLLHPFMPFITEELWQTIHGENAPAPSIALASYPQAEAGAHDAAAERQVDLLQRVVAQVRSLRAEWKVAPKQTVHLRFSGHGEYTNADLEANLVAIRTLAGIETVELAPSISPQSLGLGTAADYDLQLDLRGAIDIAAERVRLQKERDTLARGVENARRQLASESFRARAPQKVVEETERKAAELARQMAQAESSLQALDTLETAEK